MTKEEIKARQKALIDMTNDFCIEKIDEEYAMLCEKLINKLARKKDVPFKSGKLEIWAASIIHAIGMINFLYDKTIEPFIEIDDINEYFGTNKKTVSGKSNNIRKMLKLNYFEPGFTTKRMEKESPFNNFVLVDGFIVSVSSLSEDLQEMVRQARSEGRDIEFTSR
jgi:hypothetical protein